MAGMFGTLIKKRKDETASVKAAAGRKAAEQAELEMEILAQRPFPATQLNMDIETRHIQADEILCEVLKAYGHHNLVNEFNAIDKDYG